MQTHQRKSVSVRFGTQRVRFGIQRVLYGSDESPFRYVPARFRPFRSVSVNRDTALALCKTDSRRILVDVGNVSIQTISNEADIKQT